MDQKKAELDKELELPGEEIPAGTLSDPLEIVLEDKEPEQAQSLLPLASGIGRRVKRRPATLLAEPEPDAAGEFESQDDQADFPLAGWKKPSESSGLGRGGLAAVVLLLIFVPTFIFLLYQLYTATGRIDAMRGNLATFSAGNSNDKAVSNETALVLLLNKPGVKLYSLKVENLSPTGRVVFYTNGREMAFTYGNLDPLNTGQLYTFWLSTKTAGSAEAVFTRLGNIPDDRSLGRALVVKPEALPANFSLANYAEITLTIEQSDQSNPKPAGPRAFSLDLTQLKS